MSGGWRQRKWEKTGFDVHEVEIGKFGLMGRGLPVLCLRRNLTQIKDSS
jgi:hypothetical protein